MVPCACAQRSPRRHPPTVSRRRWAALAAASASAVLLLSACASESATVSAPAPETFAEGLDAPWSIAFHGDVALVSERDSARVLEVAADGEAREVAVIDGVAPAGEGGLLGLAVHDGELFTYITAQDENRVERRELRGEPGDLSLGEPTTVIDGIPAAGNHNGGRIGFGPDGMLYVTTGDAGDRDSAQDLDALGGKILRLTPEGEVPADNPFDGSPVYSYGHRNPQGIAWDVDGAMYASEFGQDTWDELNVIEAGGNYGWPEVEGIAGDDDYIDPVQQWSPDEASPSGIAVTGSDIVIANLRGERLRVVPLDDLSRSTEQYVGEFGRLRDIVVGEGGTFWVLTEQHRRAGQPGPGRRPHPPTRQGLSRRLEPRSQANASMPVAATDSPHSRLGGLGVDRPLLHTAGGHVAVVGRDDPLDRAVLAVRAAARDEFGGGRGPETGGRALGWCLETRVRRALLIDPAAREQLLAGDVPLQFGHDPTRVHREGEDAPLGATSCEADREQCVRRLRLPVGDPRVVGRRLEVDVVEPHRRAVVPSRRIRDDPRAVGQQIGHAAHEGEMTQVVGAELRLEALSSVLEGSRHDPGHVEHQIDGPAVAPHDSVNAATESRSPRSAARTSVPTNPSRACRATSGRRAGTITCTPASDSARTVSSPSPEYPPVTIAVRPARSMPAMTSAAVER